MGFFMGYGPADDKDSKETLAKAIELGCTFWDSAVVYGAGPTKHSWESFCEGAEPVIKSLWLPSAVSK